MVSHQLDRANVEVESPFGLSWPAVMAEAASVRRPGEACGPHGVVVDAPRFDWDPLSATLTRQLLQRRPLRDPRRHLVRHVRPCAVASDGGALRRMLAHSAAAYQTSLSSTRPC